MGLDMYLEGVEYIDREHTTTEDGFLLKRKVFELGYWRKHPNLHGYIVREFVNGVDDCRDVELGVEELEKILAASEADELPRTAGFFFGASQPEDKDDTRRILKAALSWLTSGTSSGNRYVVYRASW